MVAWLYNLNSGGGIGAYHIETARNELIKLPVFEIKCKAMMGICIYWISRHVIFGKRCKTVP